MNLSSILGGNGTSFAFALIGNTTKLDFTELPFYHNTWTLTNLIAHGLWGENINKE